ncbi:MAG: type II toxin-antitoxin system RelE/ParE family toxin [Phycisphaeraceae bacterium]
MSLKLRMMAEASQELREAFRYYENAEPGLGRRFVAEVARTLQGIKEYPRAWSPHRHGTRRCHTRTFPYLIIYRVSSNAITIVAVAHASREPDYWSDRLRH